MHYFGQLMFRKVLAFFIRVLRLPETKSVAHCFLSFLPVDKDLKLSSQSDHRIEISGNIFMGDALSQSPEVAISRFFAHAQFP